MQLSENVSKRGGHVYFAKTKEEAQSIFKTLPKETSEKVVKSKSMVTEEISMNHALEEIGCEVLESDLESISCK